MSQVRIETVETVDALTPEVVKQVGSLVAQLSSSAPAPTRDEIAEIISSSATVLFVARQDAEIVGILTLVLVSIPTGIRAIIEDVVVADSYRGRGIGEELSRVALERAQLAGARRVDLTSRPSREAANRLY